MLSRDCSDWIEGGVLPFVRVFWVGGSLGKWSSVLGRLWPVYAECWADILSVAAL